MKLTIKKDWHNQFSRRRPQQRHLTLQRVRLETTCSCTPIDIWERVWVEISHCFDRPEHTVREVLCKKTCLYADFDTRNHVFVCSFEHNFTVVYPTWCVSTKLYQLPQVTTCKFSLKRHVSAPFWLRGTCPCPTFNIRRHDLAETFHCFDHRIGPWDAFTVKNVPLRNF